MFEIRDEMEKLVAIGDPATGMVDARHGGRGMKITLAEGQRATLTRNGTVTEVIRRNGSFIVNRL